MKRPKRVPWIWWYVLIPLRESVWYPIKRWWYSLDEYRLPTDPGFCCYEGCECEDCRHVRKRIEEIFDSILTQRAHDDKHECVCVSEPSLRPCSICNDTGRCH